MGGLTFGDYPCLRLLSYLVGIRVKGEESRESMFLGFLPHELKFSLKVINSIDFNSVSPHHVLCLLP